jgi:hypothetical protein
MNIHTETSNPMKIPAFAEKTLPIDAQLFKIDEDRFEGDSGSPALLSSDSLTQRYQVVAPLHALDASNVFTKYFSSSSR